MLSTDKIVMFQEVENKTLIPSSEIKDEALEETVTVTPCMFLLPQIHPTSLNKNYIEILLNFLPDPY